MLYFSNEHNQSLLISKKKILFMIILHIPCLNIKSYSTLSLFPKCRNLFRTYDAKKYLMYQSSCDTFNTL